MLEWLAFLTVLGAILSDQRDRSNGEDGPRPDPEFVTAELPLQRKR